MFVVGGYLGHWGRCILVADALRKRAAADIHFVGTDPFGGLARLAKSYAIRVTILGGGQSTSPELNANQLEALFDQEKPDLLVFDGDIFRNLLYVRFPAIPQVTITNYFLTSLGRHDETAQSINFGKFSAEWNENRARRGLPPLQNHYELQDTDLVILADPGRLVPSTESLPPNYRVYGPLCWEPDIPLPQELEDSSDLLYVSIGSSGRELPYPLVSRIQAVLKTGDVLAGHPDPSVFPEPLPPSWHRYAWLPGTRALLHSRCAITQGGAGSTYQALQAGVPVVCWPRQVNHALLGQRIEAVGAGILLTGDLDAKMEKLAATFENMTATAQQFRPRSLTYAADCIAGAIERVW